MISLLVSVALLLAPEPVIEERLVVEAALPAAEDVAAFATTIDGAEASGRGVDLADLLRRVPGARVRDYGGLGSYANVSLRASTSEQVVVLLDGVPQNRALGGPVDLSSIPATRIDRVTVYRGFSPAGFGLGNLGGVVDVRTRRPEEAEGVVALLAGELSTRRLTVGSALPTGQGGSLRVDLEALHSDGDFDFEDSGTTLFDPDDDVVTRRENNEVDQASLQLQYALDVGEGRLCSSLRVQRRSRGVPGIDSFQARESSLDESQEDLTVHWSAPAAGFLDRREILLDLFRGKNEFEDPDGEIGAGIQDQTTRLDGGGIAGIFRAARGRHNLTMRTDLRVESAAVRDTVREPSDRGGADRLLGSITAEDLIILGPVALAPSLRWAHVDDEFSGSSALVLPLVEDRSESSWTGKLGVSVEVGATTRLRGSAGRFHRDPNLLELFGDRGAVVGNPALDPERGWSAELGFSARPRPAGVASSFEAVLFGRRAEDLIRLVQTSQAVATPRNIADADVYGLELSGSVGPFHGLSLDASLTLQRSEETSGFADGNPLPYQPEELAYSGAHYARGPIDLRWEITYVGENSVDRLDTPEVRIPSRIVHDAGLRYRWKATGLELGLDVRNVFDRRIRDVSRYPLPTRVTFLNLGWTWGGGRT